MVFLRLFDNKTLALNINPNSTTLAEFNQIITDRLGIPVQNQCLFTSSSSSSSSRRLIGDSASLISDLGIGLNSTLTLTVSIYGGKQAPLKSNNSNRLEFLNSKPPPSYVAGLGRGATGFTTRSDIGPASTIGCSAPSPTGVGRGRGRGSDESEEDEAEEKGYDENQKFDEFEGNDVGLFASAEYDENDKKDDAVWQAVDERMDSRRKHRREARLKEDIENYRNSNPTITEQFADLKRKLHTMSTDDWDSIPEIGDYSMRNKNRRFESFVPLPDTLLDKARQEKEHVSALDPLSRGVGGTAVTRA